MLVIPAIDLSQGQVVRLARGDMKKKTVYSDDPVATARRWADAGAQLLHVVDLDGAVSGKLANLDAVAEIIAAIDVPVELGGGLRTLDDVREVLDIGVRYAIMGTAALRMRTRSELEAALVQFGDRIIVGIDARNGKVAFEGWTEGSDIDAVHLSQQMELLGVQRLICTDIATDGMLTGPNLAAMRQFCQAVDIPIVASGGVSSVQDVKALRELAPLGLLGCIVGRALYTGDLALPEAIAAAQ